MNSLEFEFRKYNYSLFMATVNTIILIFSLKSKYYLHKHESCPNT